MEKQTLQATVKAIRRDGPTRVVVNGYGEAYSPRRAKEIHGITECDVVFIRNDGWSLGAQEKHRQIAHDMWSDQWAAKLEWGKTEAERI